MYLQISFWAHCAWLRSHVADTMKEADAWIAKEDRGMWGTFVRTIDEERTEVVHVMPCSTDGQPLHPHEATLVCPCHPRLDEDDPRVVIHNEVS